MAKRSGKRLSSRWREAMVIELEKAPDGAAIDSDGSAVDVTGALRREKSHHRGKFFRRADAAGGNLPDPVGENLFWFDARTGGNASRQIVQPGGSSIAGADVVHGDAVSGVFIRRGRTEAVNAGPGGIGSSRASAGFF